MSRKISGTKENQVFYFEGCGLIRQFRQSEPKKSLAKKKKTIFIPPNNERGKICSK